MSEEGNEGRKESSSGDGSWLELYASANCCWILTRVRIQELAGVGELVGLTDTEEVTEIDGVLGGLFALKYPKSLLHIQI